MTAPRRDLLKVRANPDSRHDYVVVFRATTPDGARLGLRLVPDRDILDPGSLAAYVAELPALGSEALALAVLDDLANELVPRWVEVRVERDSPLPHRVVVEDRQPGWTLPELASLLDRASQSSSMVTPGSDAPSSRA